MDEPLSPRTSASPGIPQCCCGRTDCAFLSHNGELLESLERDVQTAAQLGQVSATALFHPAANTLLACSSRTAPFIPGILHDLPHEIKPRSQHVNTRPS